MPVPQVDGHEPVLLSPLPQIGRTAFLQRLPADLRRPVLSEGGGEGEVGPRRKRGAVGYDYPGDRDGMDALAFHMMQDIDPGILSPGGPGEGQYMADMAVLPTGDLPRSGYPPPNRQAWYDASFGDDV